MNSLQPAWLKQRGHLVSYPRAAAPEEVGFVLELDRATEALTHPEAEPRLILTRLMER